MISHLTCRRPPVENDFLFVHRTSVWMNASVNGRDLDWRNCTFIQIICIYLKEKSQYFEYLLFLHNDP